MTRRLHPSRLTLLLAGTLLAVPLLSGCGFNPQTNRVNTISAGVNERDDPIDVLGAVVIANQDDVGLFAATFVNNDLEEEATLEGVTLDGQEFPVGAGVDAAIPPGGKLDLFDQGGIEVRGDFVAGNFIEMEVSFSTGQTTALEPNVVTACRQYSPEKLPSLQLPPVSDAPSEEPGEEPSTEESETPSATESEAEAEGQSEIPTNPYSCDPAQQVEQGEAEEAEQGEGDEETG